MNSNDVAAQYAAKTVTNELEVRYRAVEEMKDSPRFQKLLKSVLADPELIALREREYFLELIEDQQRDQRRAGLIA